MTVPGSHGSASYHLLATLLKLAPDAEAQGKLAPFFNNLVGIGMTEEEIVGELVTHLSDGFAYNTWPWGSGYSRRL
jgi:hypothetical protein